MRKESFVTGEYYHIYNRGVDKRDIFLSISDVSRFAESMLAFNNREGVGSLSSFRKMNTKVKFKFKPLVSIVFFSLLPNHFHFVIKQLVDGGISEFMKRLQGGYTYYFNVKNKRSGSLFQGSFKAHCLDNENYFNKIAGYVNKNYLIHDIPKNKLKLILASDKEYENNSFRIVSGEEGEKMLKIFDGSLNFSKHCSEVVSMIREERGQITLSEDDSR